MIYPAAATITVDSTKAKKSLDIISLIEIDRMNLADNAWTKAMTNKLGTLLALKNPKKFFIKKDTLR